MASNNPLNAPLLAQTFYRSFSDHPGKDPSEPASPTRMMRIVFQVPIPAALAEIAGEPFVIFTLLASAVFFKPLSALGLYEDRIDITVKSDMASEPIPANAPTNG